jgi:aldose 1-epimerase
VKLAAGAWEATLRPEVGGALASLRLGGEDVLRAMPPAATNPLAAACFPLVPYANRIRDGRFAFGGRAVQLPLNFLPQRHSLHGLGWQRPWHAIQRSEAEAVLVDEYDGSGAWPWAWRAEQHVALDETGLSIALSLTNRSDHAMPAGLGLHPYFRRRPETRVRFAATGVLEVDDEFMPSGAIAPADRFGAWNEGAFLPAELVDNCHVGWSGLVEIADDLGRIAMTATGAPHLHVYAPPGGAELCFEPVSHTPDAINRALGEITVLTPGATAQLRMWIEAERA